MNDNRGPSDDRTRTETRPELILHPVRMRILMVLAGGAPRTVAELATDLPDVPPATLYRHLGALRRGGILAVVHERRVRGAVERRYALEPGAATLGPDDLARATPDDHVRWFAGFVAGLLGSFARYVASGTPDLVRDGVGYRQVVFNLSDSELGAMATALNAALLPYVANPAAEGRRARLFATILMPADQAQPHSS